MPSDIIMPNACFDTLEARIVEWLVKPGDTINKGDVIAVIESDKANVELESLAGGTVLEVLYEVNTDIPIGATIARVGSPDEVPAKQSTMEQTATSSAASVTADVDDPRISP